MRGRGTGYAWWATALLAVAGIGDVTAQDAAMSARLAQSAGELAFDIPAQSLDRALAAYAARTGRQVVAPGEVTAGLVSSPVQGTFTPEQALDRLLAGTGVVARESGGGALVLERAAPRAGDGAVILDPLTVEAQASVPATAEIGNVPPPFAGGQVATGGQVGILGNRDLFDTPFSTESFTEQLIQDRQATSLTDVLDFDPSVVPLGRGDAFEYLNIRGFTVFPPFGALLNGLRIPIQQAAVPEFYDRIELIKGPSALLYPQAGGIGGTVNFVPKAVGATPLTAGTVSVGSDIQYRAHADASRRFGPNGEFGARINAVGNTGDTFREHGENDLAAGALSLDYLGERVRLQGYADLTDGDWQDKQPAVGTFAGTGRVPTTDPRSYASFSWASYNAFSQRGMLAGEFDLNEGLTAFVRFGGARTDGTNTGSFGCSFTSDGACSITPYRYREDFSFLAGDLGIRGVAEFGPVRHQVSAVFSASRQWYDGHEDDFAPLAVDIFDPAGGSDPTRGEPASSYGLSGDTRIKGPAIADTISVLDERVQLTLGARIQNIQQKNEFEGETTGDYDQWQTTPAVGLVVKPGLGLSFYGNYIQGLEPGDTAPPGAANAGQSLPPRVSTQKEVGVKWDGGRIGLTAALFEITRPLSILGSDNVFRDDGEQRSRGLELATFGEPLPGLRLLGGVTFLNAEQVKTQGGVNDGNEVPGAPDYVVKMSAEWDVPLVDGLTLSGLVIRQGSQAANNANTNRLEGWTRLDLGTRYAVTDRLTLRARVTNVLDQEYWEASDRGIYYSIGAPRTFIVSGSVTF